MTTTNSPGTEDTSCFVCGGPQHPDQPITPTSGHRYWSSADALAEARADDRRMRLARTPEAAYVAEYRPY